MGPSNSCADAPTALAEILASEAAFSQRAKASVRDAFLEYLAEQSWVFDPGPTPGRAVYEASSSDKDRLDWYPTLAAAAPSGDLGVTLGPWVLDPSGGGAPSKGHFLTVWRREAPCRWRVVVDAGISHAASDAPTSYAEPTPFAARAGAENAAGTVDALPPAPQLVADGDADRAIADFEATAREDGLSAALRTYGRNDDFMLLADGVYPIAGMLKASWYFHANDLLGIWRERARGRSADSALGYTLGELTDRSGLTRTHAYVEIWQYDSKVANWGLRILLIKALKKDRVGVD